MNTSEVFALNGSDVVVVQAIYADGSVWSVQTETPVSNLHAALSSLDHNCVVYRACSAAGKILREWVRARGCFVEVRP